MQERLDENDKVYTKMLFVMLQLTKFVGVNAISQFVDDLLESSTLEVGAD